MARRVPRAVLALTALISTGALDVDVDAAPLKSGSILAQYSFEDEVDPGPDTFAVFQHSKGTVSLSPDFRISGYRSVKIKDRGGSGDFPELQGYFDTRTTGRVFAHFAILVTNPDQSLNIALAGPAHFTTRKDGIAFWLLLQDGILRHHSDGIPKRLFPIEPFVWYEVEVDYNVDRGRYTLSVRQEGHAEPRVLLRDQPNATSEPGSAVNMFSFISDLEDRSDVEYYVDDVLIGTDASILQVPFVAPGRRKLFVDSFRELQSARELKLGCFGNESPAELGNAGPLWQRGCSELGKGAAPRAEALFRQALESHPTSLLLRVSWVTALAEMGRMEEAEDALRLVEDVHDMRFAVTSAWLARKRNDPIRAEVALHDLARAPGPLRPELDPVAERYFHLLLWQERWTEARQYAAEIGAELTGARQVTWLERAGDAALLARDIPLAESFYERVLRVEPDHAPTILKMADVAFFRGDLKSERTWRERIYGTLTSE